MRTRRIRAALWVLGLLSGVAPALAASEQVERANQRWRGAHAVLQQPIRLHGGADRDGWTGGWWRKICGFEEIPIQVRCKSADGSPAFSYLLRVSNRDAVKPLLRGKELPAGTRFDVVAWRPLTGERGFFLDLKLRDAPARARLHFAETREDVRAGMSVERLEQIEQFLRIRLFEVESPAETLAAPQVTAPDEPAVPTFRGTTASAPSAATPSSPSAAGTTVFAPVVRVHNNSVRPPRFAAGDEIEFLVTFDFRGVAPNALYQLEVIHEILDASGTVIVALSEEVTYSPGTFTNARRIRSDKSQPPGLYTLRSTVRFAGVSEQATALFSIEAD